MIKKEFEATLSASPSTKSRFSSPMMMTGALISANMPKGGSDNGHLMHVDQINSRLASNGRQLIALLRERADLISRQRYAIQQEADSRLQRIAGARLSDLKSMFKDEPNLIKLVEEAQRRVKTIRDLEASSFQKIRDTEGEQVIKNKSLFDLSRKLEEIIAQQSQRMGVLTKSLESFNEKEKSKFIELERFQQDLTMVMRNMRKDPQQERKAAACQSEIKNRRDALRKMKEEKDGIRGQLVGNLKNLLEKINSHYQDSRRRAEEVSGLYGDDDDLEAFGTLVGTLGSLLESRKTRGVDYYAAEENELNDIQVYYTKMEESLNEAMSRQNAALKKLSEKSKMKEYETVIEKAYLMEGRVDSSRLEALFEKAKKYLAMLNNLDSDRNRILAQLKRCKDQYMEFQQYLRIYTEREQRRDSFRGELGPLVAELHACQYNQKLSQDSELQLKRMELKKNMLERDLQYYSERGNMDDFTTRKAQLEQVERAIDDIRNKNRQMGIEERKRFIEAELVRLYQKYSDIIQEMKLDGSERITQEKYAKKVQLRLSVI